MTTFDPKVFESMTFTESNSTESVPCPVGDWPAVVDSKKVDTWTGRDNSSSGLKLILMWKIEDPSVIAEVGREKVLVKQEMLLDLTETGGLDFGKGMNVQLGRTRAALGLNNPGEPFSFDMFPGRRGLVNVTHRPDPNKPGVIYAEVKGVAAV